MNNKTKKDYKLPGALSDHEFVQQAIRVNHAGEYGAKRIYEGQLAILKKSKFGYIIEEMKQQEQEHLDYFTQQIIARKVRPTIFLQAWHIAGFALGAFSALLGSKAAMAATVAVEETIDEHYSEQIAAMPSHEEDLKKHIIAFKEDEENHKNEAINHDALEMPGYKLFSAFVKTGCKAAIWLSKKF